MAGGATGTRGAREGTRRPLTLEERTHIEERAHLTTSQHCTRVLLFILLSLRAGNIHTQYQIKIVLCFNSQRLGHLVWAAFVILNNRQCFRAAQCYTITYYDIITLNNPWKGTAKGGKYCKNRLKRGCTMSSFDVRCIILYNSNILDFGEREVTLILLQFYLAASHFVSKIGKVKMYVFILAFITEILKCSC